MHTKKFQKRKENFTCEQCASAVVGNGYTNHCPSCLWSKHVDVNPGDRAEACGGMMQPIGVETERGASKIVHRCLRCGVQKKNKVSGADNQDVIIRVATHT